MSSIDERIVEMRFNNSQFEKGIKETTASLAGLKSSLSLDNAKKGLENLSDIGKNFSLSHIADGIDSISSKFSALAGIGVVALGNIASQAIQTGIQMVRSLTLQPITDGFNEYELKMGSIQTILANTSKYGTTLDDVTKALDDLNTYSDKTIYNFGAMTKNIGLFTNAGIKLEDATSMIKGFSNAAAASGTSAENAAGAAYQLSQALSAGTVRLMDWRSLTNAGMGSKNMQQGLIDIADAMGTLSANGIDATTVQKDFNGSLEKNWLSADVMSSYLKIMAGDMDDASMAALGLSAAQIESFRSQQKTAEEAATKIRTFTQLMSTMKESVASSWSETFNILFGNFNEATDLFTGINDAFGSMIKASSDARNGLLEDWKKLGGRTVLIEAVSDAFKALMSVVKPIMDAFRDIFPPATAKQLYDITVAVKNFMSGLILSAKSSENLKNTFRGLFAVLDIIWMAIKGVASVFARLLAPLSKTGDGVLTLTGGLGNMLVNLRDAIKSGNFFGKVFEFIGNAIAAPIELLNKFGKAVVGSTQTSTGFATVWEGIANGFQAVWSFIKPAVDWIIDSLKTVGTAIADFFKQMNPASFAAILAGGGVAAMGVGVFKFASWIRNTFGVLGFNIIDQIQGVLGSVTDAVKSMQTQIQSKTLMNIAIALGILAGAILILSFIPIDKLGIALGGVTVMLIQLVGAMALFDKFVGTKGAVKMGLISFALIGLATAMVIFAAAIKIMSSMDWNELARGLAGMAGALTLMVASVKLLASGSGKLIFVAFALTGFATAMVILAAAMKIFASLSWDEVGRGLAVMAGMLGIIVVFSKVMGGIGGVVSGALGLIIIAGAMMIMAGAMKVFATLSWDEIGRGLVLLAGSLAIIVIAMQFMQSAILGAASMIIISVALTILAGALKIMATMSWDEIGRGMVVLAGSLLILAGAMYLMSGALPGAAALLVAAGALMILAPALKMLGKMSWDEIGRGLTMLAASLLIIAAAGVVLIAALPGLLGLGVAALLIGVGALAAGVGITMLSAGLVALGAASSVGTAALVFMATQLIGLIPLIALKIGEGIIAIAGVIATSGPTLIAAFVTLITSMVTAIATVGPLIINTFFDLIMLLVARLTQSIPVFVDSGMKMIAGILQGIGNNIGRIVDAAVTIIVNFIDAIGRNLPRIIEAGIKLVLSFINGVADGVNKYSSQMVEAGSKLFRAIVNGVSIAIERGGADLRWAGQRIGQALLNGAKAALGIASPSKEFYKLGEFTTQGITNGLDDTAKYVALASENVGNTAVDGLKKSLNGISDIALGNMDMTPTIRPVLDLSAIKKDSSLINGIIAPAPLSIDAGYAKAASISAEQKQMKIDTATASETAVAPAGDTNISFVQNNTSPKALTPAEIYRQTKNQLSAAKGVVVLV